MNTLTLPVMGLLVTIPVMIAVGQVLFKMTSEKLALTGAPLYSMFFNPVCILALAIYGIATILWIYVLKSAPLAYAYSFMALTFVIVPILASLWLGETVTSKYLIGTGLIMAGLVIVQSQ